MTIPLQFASLYHGQVFMWSDCLLDLGTDFLVGNMAFVWSLRTEGKNNNDKKLSSLKGQTSRCIFMFAVSSTANYLRHPGTGNPTPGSTYSAPPTYLKKGADSTIRGGSVLRVTDDLSGRRPLERKRPMSEVAYATARPRSVRGTLPRELSLVVMF